MSKENNLTDFLTDIANTLRTQTNTTATINPQNFSTMISNDLVGKAWVEGKYLPLTGGTLTGFLACDKGLGVYNDPLTLQQVPLQIWGGLSGVGCFEFNKDGEISFKNDSSEQTIWKLTGISDSTGDSSTVAVSQKGLKNALTGVEFNLPIYDSTGRGEGSNALAFNTGNAVQSENTNGFGSGNLSGLKGYYWSNISTTGSLNPKINANWYTITLSSAHTGGTAINCEYVVGDSISIVKDVKYNDCATIAAINNNVITIRSDLSDLATTSTGEATYDNFCIYCNAKPTIGAADLGKNATAFGENNKALNRSSFATGRENTVVGQYGFAAGRGNTVAYASFAAGRNNNISHDYSCGIGWNNTSGGQVSTLIGYGNTGRGNYNFLIGASNDTSKNVTEQISIGFANHSEAKTTFSIGKNNKHYLPNGIIIGTNNIGQGGVCLGDNNTVRENQYTVGKNNRENFKADNVYRLGESLLPNSNQTIVGRYNKQVSSTASFIVGVGTSDTDRKNGMWVTSDGNIVAGGSKITFNGNGSPTAFTVDDLTNTAKTATAAKNATETIKKTYLPLSGGYLTGSLYFNGENTSSQFTDSYICVLDNAAKSTITVYGDRIGCSTFGGGWEFRGITDRKGTSSEWAMSQKGVADNYVAKSDLPSNLLKYQIITSTSQIGTDTNTAYLILE